MTLVYGSVCSGIEAATVAWHPLGWRPSFFSEIEPFPRAVLAHHYPHVPLHGDFTTIEADQYAALNVLVGGTPCQSFSIAGLRAGLDDERGNLALEFCRLARRLGPKWVVWENVPGVLSLDDGRAFASILGGLAECGYGLAYRVLDAQFVRVDGFGRAVPQRRRRVFVVGCLGDWRRAAAVLFERQSLSWDTPPRREARQGAAATVTASAGERGATSAESANFIPLTAIKGAAHALTATATATGHLDPSLQDFVGVAHALRAEGFDASEDGTGRGTPIVPIQEVSKRTGKSSTSLKAGDGIENIGDPMFTLGADSRHGVAIAGTLGANGKAAGSATGQDAENGLLLPIAFDETQITSATNRRNPQPGDPSHPLAAGARAPAIAFNARQDPDVFHGHTVPLDTDGSTQAVMSAWRVRRLTPRECERLQGFPDGYTDVPYRRRNWTPDGPRYKALGNSMAVNVMRWIGTRIAAVDALAADAAATEQAA